MKPYYCVRLEGPTWPSAQQTKLRELVETWLEAEHPFDDRGPGVSIRLDAENPEQWWRYTIDESLNGGAIVSTTITILNLDKKSTFEVRTSVIPGGSRVTPLSIKVSVKTKRALLARVVETVTLYDAGMKIGTKAAVITEPSGAEAIAAFFEAPSRSLPIVIETMLSFESSVFEAHELASELAGLAHVVQIVGSASRTAFNEFHGRDVLPQQGLVILWPDHTNSSIVGNGMLAGAGVNDRNYVRQSVTDIASDSLAPLRAPRFRRRAVEQEVETRVVEAEKKELDALGDPETVSWAEYRSALDGWQETEERVGELEQALAEADRIVAEKQQLLEKGDQVVDQLVLQNTELAIRLGRSPSGLVATSAIDAVRQAKSMCENLVFHEQALRSAEQIQGIDANRLLQDLVRLNIVAGDWQTGRISNSSLTISCRSFGLNYAAGIGEVAENKYGEDYSFTWRGRTEYAVAHIRNGRGVHLYRVHVFFDDDSHQVVVAYIGRHLRGKRDHS
jgi:hypothetical protein